MLYSAARVKKISAAAPTASEHVTAQRVDEQRQRLECQHPLQAADDQRQRDLIDARAEGDGENLVESRPQLRVVDVENIRCRAGT